MSSDESDESKSSEKGELELELGITKDDELMIEAFKMEKFEDATAHLRTSMLNHALMLPSFPC